MAEHPWASDVLAVVMLLVALYCTGRLVFSFGSRRTTQRDTDAVHAVMGVSMAGMLKSSWAAAPPGLWVLVFSASAVWFGWRVLRNASLEPLAGHSFGQYLSHLLMCAAMVYMLFVMEWTTSMSSSPGNGPLAMGSSGTGAAQWPLLALLLAVLLFGDVALTASFNLRRFPLPRLAQAGVATVRVDEPARSQGGSDLSDVARPTVGGPVRAARVMAPHSGLVCQLVMSLVMGYMLVTIV